MSELLGDSFAWLTIITAYIIIIVPLIGDMLVAGNTISYKDALKIGLSFHAVLIVVTAIIGIILWAFVRVAT